MEKRFHTVKSPAKLNIRLKITGRRSDGYHELVSIMVPLRLFDILEMELSSAGGHKISCSGYKVPEDESNLALRAAIAFFSKTGIGAGLNIRLKKNIPVAAGLGGGSSNAAAVLKFLNKQYSNPLSGADLHSLALSLGADVPFFLYCQPSIARGIGEKLEPIINFPELWFIIITPLIHVSTSWVYSNYRMKLTTDEYTFILKNLKKEDLNISHILENDLEEVTSASFPVIKSIKNELLEAGAEGALMSGSGPSVFGLFSSKEKAEFAKSILLDRSLGDVFLVRSL